MSKYIYKNVFKVKHLKKHEYTRKKNPSVISLLFEEKSCIDP